MKREQIEVTAEMFLAILKGHKTGWAVAVPEAVQKMQLLDAVGFAERTLFEPESVFPVLHRDAHLLLTVLVPEDWDGNLITFTEPGPSD